MDLANRLNAGGRHDDIERELEGLDVAQLDDDELEAWHRMRGIAAFERGDRELARERFEVGMARFPESAYLAFSVGQEYEYLGQVDRAFELFERAPFPSVPSGFVMAQARYAYLWNKLAEGVALLQPLVDAYWDLGIVDDHFLYTRGFPSFRDVWASLGALHEQQGSLPVMRGFTERAARDLADCNADGMFALLDFIESGDATPYVAGLRRWVEEFRAQGLPTGQPELREAVVAALREPDSDRARGILAAVELGDNDFPWLDDMRLLARCHLSRTAGDEETERLLAEWFRERQPYLFEPYHVFEYRLLDAQEPHRLAYQAERMERSTAC